MVSARLAGAWALLFSAASLAEPAPEAPAESEPPPSLEMLLYLGEFETTEGETVDPMTLNEEGRPPTSPAQIPAETLSDEQRPHHAAARR